MKVVFTLILIIFSVHISIAQNAKIENLNKVIQTTRVDSTKGRALCRLCDELRKTDDLLVGLQKAQEGLKIVEQIKDVEGIAGCMNAIGSIYLSKSNYKEASEYYHKALERYEQINNKKGVATSFNNIGNLYLYQQNYPKVLDYYHKSIKIYEQINYKAGIASCLSNIGIIYSEQANHTRALEYHQKALKYYEELGKKDAVANCYNNIGNIYLYQGDNTQALKLYQKSLDIGEQAGDKDGISTSLNNIATVYADQGDYPKALVNFQKSLQISKERNDRSGMVTALNNIGAIYSNEGKYRQSLEYLQKSLKIEEEANNQEGISTSLSSIGVCYYNLNNSTEAHKYAYKALRLARKLNNFSISQDAAMTLFMVDSALGNWKGALEAYKLFKIYSDSLHNAEKSKEFGKIESRHQFEKEMELQKQIAEAQAQEIIRRNNLQYLVIFVGIIGLFGVLIFIGRFHVSARVANIALFTGILILFEFFLILFDPWMETFSGGIPYYKLIFNAILGIIFSPLHNFIEDIFRKKLLNVT